MTQNNTVDEFSGIYIEWMVGPLFHIIAGGVTIWDVGFFTFLGWEITIIWNFFIAFFMLSWFH